MEDIKAIVAENIVMFRKQNDLTQIGLAEKINYSDKAVSRWEKAEVTPDVETLAKMAEIFNVSIEAFFTKDHAVDNKTDGRKSNKIIVSLLSMCGVWVLATVLYVIFHSVTGTSLWQIFIYAVPVTFIIAVVFAAVWGNKFWIFFFISLLMWSLLISVYVTLLKFNVWTVFFIGIPSQAVIILASFIKKLF